MEEHNIKLDELRKFIDFLDDGLKNKEADIFKNKIDNLHRICSMFMSRIKDELHELKNQELDSDNEEIYNEYKDDNGDVDSVSDYDIECDIDIDEIRDSDEETDIIIEKEKFQDKINNHTRITEQFKSNCKDIYEIMLKTMPVQFISKQMS